MSSIPPIGADVPNVVWAIDFQFDSTIDGKAIKIASMIDEHIRWPLLDIVERSITADRLVEELKTVFAVAGGPPKVLRMDNGPEFISRALQQFCDRRVGMSYIPRGTRWNNWHIESFNNRLRMECLNRNHMNTLSSVCRLSGSVGLVCGATENMVEHECADAAVHVSGWTFSTQRRA